jgi:hypothetical protein
VVFVLSTLDFLEPDLGVMLLLRIDEGVVCWSREYGAMGVASCRVARRIRGVELFEGTVPAILGVTGAVLAALRAAWLIVGSRGLLPWTLFRSEGIAFPLFNSDDPMGARIISWRVSNGSSSKLQAYAERTEERLWLFTLCLWFGR